MAQSKDTSEAGMLGQSHDGPGPKSEIFTGYMDDDKAEKFAQIEQGVSQNK